MDRVNLEWEPTWILPNVVVNPPIESNPFAIVPRTDARVIEFGKRHPPFARFIGKFKDEFHVVGEPSMILLHVDAPPSCRTADCLTAFRNVLALSVTPYQWAQSILFPNYSGICWGDTFAFYPWSLGSDNEHLVCNTAAMFGLHLPDEFYGQRAPALPMAAVNSGTIDQPLFEELRKRWQECYVDGATDENFQRLFRSLDMAYNASLLPSTSNQSIFDLGRRVALWVSAFEILVHPGEGSANEARVRSLLNTYQYLNTVIQKQKFGPHKLGLAAWVYSLINAARNDFLHGNPVTSASLSSIPGGGASLFIGAGPLYRLALSAKLNLYAPAKPNPFDDCEKERREAVKKHSRFQIHQKNFEDALYKIATPAKV